MQNHNALLNRDCNFANVKNAIFPQSPSYIDGEVDRSFMYSFELDDAAKMGDNNNRGKIEWY